MYRGFTLLVAGILICFSACDVQEPRVNAPDGNQPAARTLVAQQQPQTPPPQPESRTAQHNSKSEHKHEHKHEQKHEQKHGESQRAPSTVRQAVSVLSPVGGSDVSGVVYFSQVGPEVEIRGTIRGLEPGKHAFHVHEYGDLTDQESGESAGSHYNPADQPHGRPEDAERHVGDFGNITADETGTAEINFVDRMVQLNGPYSILGRALVVHAEEDEFTQPSGGAGPRVGFGVIGVANPTFTPEEYQMQEKRPSTP